ncbi:MAG: type III pantothenate kinase [Clostridia bacterium]|nr:type III pantothenate kinase [Clostridia bacterium]
MILAIDCGNTHITLGCVDQSNIASAVFRIPTDREETEFGYAVKIKQALELAEVELSDFEGAALSSVVPPVTDTLVRALRLLTKKEPLLVGAGIKTGLHICTNDPGAVASDLVTSAVAAKELYALPAIIVDMGTATTLTVVDEKGRFIGGAILPGVKISLDALSQNTALLPHIDIRPPLSPIGACTMDCMKSGIVFGTAGSVDGLIDRFEKALGAKAASVIATGGLCTLIAPHCQHEMTVDETLILKGLSLIWYKNKATEDTQYKGGRHERRHS